MVGEGRPGYIRVREDGNLRKTLFERRREAEEKGGWRGGGEVGNCAVLHYILHEQNGKEERAAT